MTTYSAGSNYVDQIKKELDLKWNKCRQYTDWMYYGPNSVGSRAWSLTHTHNYHTKMDFNHLHATTDGPMGDKNSPNATLL